MGTGEWMLLAVSLIVAFFAAAAILARRFDDWVREDRTVVEPEPPVVIGPSVPILVGAEGAPGPPPVEFSAARALRQQHPATASGLVVEPPPEIVVRPEPEIVVEAVGRAVWDELGWVQSTVKRKNVYTGFYRASKAGQPWAFPGRIVAERSAFVPYIADPPPEIKKHPKGPCFHLVGAPWFRVDWHRPARCADDAILYVEKVLDEALNGRR